MQFIVPVLSVEISHHVKKTGLNLEALRAGKHLYLLTAKFLLARLCLFSQQWLSLLIWSCKQTSLLLIQHLTTVLIDHKTKVISVSENAVSIHLPPGNNLVVLVSTLPIQNPLP